MKAEANQEGKKQPTGDEEQLPHLGVGVWEGEWDGKESHNPNQEGSSRRRYTAVPVVTSGCLSCCVLPPSLPPCSPSFCRSLTRSLGWLGGREREVLACYQLTLANRKRLPEGLYPLTIG